MGHRVPHPGDTIQLYECSVPPPPFLSSLHPVPHGIAGAYAEIYALLGPCQTCKIKGYFCGMHHFLFVSSLSPFSPTATKQTTNAAVQYVQEVILIQCSTPICKFGLCGAVCVGCVSSNHLSWVEIVCLLLSSLFTATHSPPSSYFFLPRGPSPAISQRPKKVMILFLNGHCVILLSFPSSFRRNAASKRSSW